MYVIFTKYNYIEFELSLMNLAKINKNSVINK